MSKGTAEDYYSIGTKCLNIEEYVDAERYLCRSIEMDNTNPNAYYNLGILCFDLNRFKEAIYAYKAAITLNPTFTKAYFNLGLALRKMQLMEAATTMYRRTIQLDPNYLEAYVNLAVTLQYLGHFDEAEQMNRQALAMNPNHGMVKNNLALIRLLKGDYIEGLHLYESRFNGGPVFDITNSYIKKIEQAGVPRWQGLYTNKLLLLAEQGAGDNIMMMRYLDIIKHCEHAKEIVVYCEPNVKRLYKEYGIQVIDTKSKIVFSDYTAYCPIMSLPLVYGTGLESIPSTYKYLEPTFEKFEPQFILHKPQGKPTVGIAWAGSSSNGDDNIRSLSFAQIQPLLQNKNINWVSLQKGQDAGMHMTDVMESCKDFYDTAKIISQLDLVISVDTSIAHLAGAMGKKVWLMNRFKSEWRWLLDRTDSPWYRTIKIFRQPTLGDWKTVVSQVADDLACFVV